MRCVFTALSVHWTVVLVVCLTGNGSRAVGTTRGELNATGGDMAMQTEVQYEWVVDEVVYQYAQQSSFSLLAFNVPFRTEKAEFRVTFYDQSEDGKERDVILSVRRAAIPVIQAYNETVPDLFLLPSDQQTFHVNNSGHYTLTLTSPTPGRVYVMASILNPVDDVIQYLRWGKTLTGDCAMDVMAVYTRRNFVTSLVTDDVNTVDISLGKAQTFGFLVPAFTTSYSLTISNCSLPGNGNSCPVTMTTSESLSPDDPSAVSVDCQKSGEDQRCLLKIISPKVESEHFVTFSANSVGDDVIRSGVDNIMFDVSFDFEGCVSFGSASFTSRVAGQKVVFLRHYKHLTGYDATHNDVIVNAGCHNLGPLGRVSVPPYHFNFRAYFGTLSMQGDITPNFDLIASDQHMAVRTFTLKDSVDTGGTLHISAKLLDGDWRGRIWLCAMANRVAQNGSLEQCPNGALVTMNATGNYSSFDNNKRLHGEVFAPFPLYGTWYVAVQSQCLGDSGPEACEMLPMIEVTVQMAQCATDQCGQYGTCQQYIEGTTIFASCECSAGYRGLSCNDALYALTDSEQLTAVYLLTLSNLAFLPAICLALHRRFLDLAAVFTFNFFFSCFYHACDSSQVYKLCIMEYKTLAFGDFFGSVLSFFTMLATMARIPHTLRTSLLLCGSIAIATIITGDMHSDIAHIVPLIIIGIVLVTSWAREMRVRRKLFPSKRRYQLYLVPGLMLAGLGIGINFGLMHDLSIYQFTHSFWHLSLMISPCFLMPPRRKSAGTKDLAAVSQDVTQARQELASSVNSDRRPLIPEGDQPVMALP